MSPRIGGFRCGYGSRIHQSGTSAVRSLFLCSLVMRAIPTHRLRCLDPCSAFGAQVEQSSNHLIDPLSMSFEQVQQKESLRTTPLMNAPLEKVLGLLITVMTPNSRSTRHQLIRFQGCQLVAIHHRLTSTVSFISSTGMRSMYEKGLAHPSLRVDHCYYKQ